MGVDRELLERIRTRGREVVTQISAELMAKPGFARVLEGALRGRERLEQAAAAALKQMNVSTRGELKRANARIDALERELAGLRQKSRSRRAGRKPQAAAGASRPPRAGRRTARRTKPVR